MVKPKKHLGQHFLRNDEVSERISNSLTFHHGYSTIVEIGPGTGALTKHLLAIADKEIHVVEIDRESVDYLTVHFPALRGRIHAEDFLRADPDAWVKGPFGLAGNFPYNISSQILFRMLEFRDRIPELVGMFQKEVALRVTGKPGNRDYGILSVFVQAYYHAEYLFTVDEHEFFPPPKVKSGVIRLVRNDVKQLPCDEKLFHTLVKTGYNQRRKMLSNSLKSLIPPGVELPGLNRRPEELGVQDWVELANAIRPVDL
ncbi:MAG: hypothetical protein RL220_353 [Bacteroidota bacterium]|jgi:16S rRNA (adenine1518-N6/adenine1519-N6)-dimethyltransferase